MVEELEDVFLGTVVREEVLGSVSAEERAVGLLEAHVQENHHLNALPVQWCSAVWCEVGSGVVQCGVVYNGSLWCGVQWCSVVGCGV